MTENPFTVDQHLGPFDNCHPLRSADYAGVYFLFRRRAIVYVGKTKSVAQRIAQHRGIKNFDAVMVMRVPEEILSAIEMQWIQQLRPKLNRQYGLNKKAKSLRFTPETFRKLKIASSQEGVSETVYVELALKDRFRKDGIT